MSSIREAAERDRITVKIHNMKRSASREPPTRSKRGRGDLARYEDSSDERVTPDRMRRRVARSPSPRARYISPHREEYVRVPREPPVERGHPYKVLCVSPLHPKASDEFIKETLFREFKKFGDMSIRLAHDHMEERVAYVCFRASDDAREAKHAKPRIVLYDKVAVVEPVYETARPEYKYKPRSITPEYERPPYYPRSPVPERRRPPVEMYHERYGPPPAVIHHPREFRPGPPMHHDPYLPRGPPMHHPHHPPMHHPPHHYPPRHMVPRHPAPPHENKKDKFPNYLHHVQPEEDPLATRTLFLGNLEINISEEELRRIFGKYGILEDIDIKRPPPGTGNAFAFVRYQNLDMAHRAKVELSGQYIGKFQCKIGYGKATPTTRIWVGGLGVWTSVAQLEREFDRFGVIKKIEYQKGDLSANILYESIEAATAAVKEMRGFALGGPERRLRIDFSDVGNAQPPFKPKQGPPFEDGPEFPPRRPEYDNYHEPPYEEPYGGFVPRGGYRGRGRGRGGYRGGYHHEAHRPTGDEEWRRGPPEMEYDTRIRRTVSREPGLDRNISRSPRRRSPDSDSDASSRRNGMLSAARTLPEVARKCTTLWSGALILKSSLFPAKFHLTDGDAEIVEGLMKDEGGTHHLRITQRLRLDPPKLEDVQKRIQTSSSHAIFLGMTHSTSSVQTDDPSVQTRPLRNLVSYLKQKEAAGVISLLNKDTEATGVLYAFPPCEFSSELLKRTCHNVSEEGLKEDHLVIVVVRGGAA